MDVLEYQNKLFHDNLGLVQFVLSKNYPYVKFDEDLQQLAKLALWQAVISFDEQKDCEFSTYATQCIYLNVTYELIKRGKLKKTEITIMDSKLFEDETTTFAETIESSINVESTIVAKIMSDKIIAILTPRERKVLQMKCDGYTFSEIGKEIGVSKRWITKIFADIKSKVGKEILDNGGYQQEDCLCEKMKTFEQNNCCSRGEQRK